MLDGFLLGDAELVKASSNNIAQAMSKIVRAVPVEGESQAIAWEAMSKIMKETLAIEKSLGENDYPSAYNAYVSLAGRCIRCHQAVRDYGTFVEPEPEEQAVPTTK